MKNSLYIAFSIVLAALMLHSCHGNMHDHVIASNEYFTITGDSLTMGDTVVYSTDGTTLNTNMLNAQGQPMHVSYNIPAGVRTGTVNTPFKLIDALSKMSVSFISDPNNLHFDTNSDLYDAIGLTLSYTNPQLSMSMLKALVKDGVISGNEGNFYPAFNNRMAWTTAAWRVYLATGDKAWLKYAYDVSVATFEQEQEIAFYKRDWLVRGCSSDYTPLVEALPAWMDNSDVFSTFTLSNNVETAHALEAMSEMAYELGINGNRYAFLARDLNAAVNENLWNESHGQYTALIYGQSCTLHAPCSDNRAQALAVMWGIADEDDRGTTLIEKTAVTHLGINNFFPSRTGGIEPCLNERSWGLTQGLWNMAAAHVDNDNALRRGMAALYRAQALYSTLFINEGSANLDINCAISNVAMTHRLLFGMQFEGDGIEFTPVVPSCLGGDNELTGFAYRDGTLDITVKGSGHDVDYITLDGQRINGTFIAASELHGEHSIVIQMKQGRTSARGITIANAFMQIPSEPIVSWDGDSAYIYNYNAAQAYKLVIDGKISYTINDSVFAVPQISTFSELCVIAANKRCFSYTSRPFIMGGNKFKYYPISNEMAQSDPIKLKVNVPEGGDYMISINFTSPVKTCDARIVTANTHKQGVTLLSGLNIDSVAGQSNLIHVDLLRNDNTITISGLPTCHGQAKPISVNLFKK